MPIKTPLYGSGNGERVFTGSSQNAPIEALNTLLTLPFTLANQVMSGLAQSIQGLGGDGYDSRQFREFSPHGEVVPKMTTKQLTAKNIFGAGGSQ